MNPKAREDLIVEDSTDCGSITVTDPQTGDAVELKPFEAWLLERCDGSRSVTELRDALSEKVGTVIEHEALWSTLDGFDDNGLLAARTAPRAGANYPVDRRGLLKGLFKLPAAAAATAVAVSAPAAAQDSGVEQLTKAAEQQSKAAAEDAQKAAEEAQQKVGQQEQVRKAQEQLEKIQEQGQKGGGETGLKEQGVKEANDKSPVAISEPGSVALFGTGLGALALARMIQRRGQVEQDEKSGNG